MSDELKTPYESGSTLYACVRNEANDVWYVVGEVFEAWGTAARDAADYAITQTSDTGDMYVGDFDVNIAAGHYYVASYLQAGGTPADSDNILPPGGEIWWDGTAEVPPANQDDVTGAHATTDALIAALGANVLSVLNIYDDRTGALPGGTYPIVETEGGGVYP